MLRGIHHHLMWTDAREELRPITISTQHLIAGRETTPFECLIQVVSHSFPLFRSVIVDVVDSQKNGIRFSTTLANAPVVFQHFRSDCSCAIFAALVAMRCSISCRWRKLLHLFHNPTSRTPFQPTPLGRLRNAAPQRSALIPTCSFSDKTRRALQATSTSFYLTETRERKKVLATQTPPRSRYSCWASVFRRLPACSSPRLVKSSGTRPAKIMEAIWIAGVFSKGRGGKKCFTVRAPSCFSLRAWATRRHIYMIPPKSFKDNTRLILFNYPRVSSVC